MTRRSTDARDDGRRLEGGRLTYYRRAADAAYWNELWRPDIRREYFAPHLAGDLGPFEQMFPRHLPESGLVVEAGCGLGQWVVALRARGYNCIGLDYASGTLREVRRLLPELPLVAADVTGMGLRDGSCAAVISLGVVEHRREGPEPFLDEMRRILAPGGRLLISVPYFNPLRQWRGRRGAYTGDVSGLEFYQYAYSEEEFRQALGAAGFRVLTRYTYDHRKSLRQEIPVLRHLPMLLHRVVMRLADQVPVIRRELGHMLLCVAERVDRAVTSG